MAGYKSARCKRQSYSGVWIQIAVSETLTLLFCLHSCAACLIRLRPESTSRHLVAQYFKKEKKETKGEIIKPESGLARTYLWSELQLLFCMVNHDIGTISAVV